MKKFLLGPALAGLAAVCLLMAAALPTEAQQYKTEGIEGIVSLDDDDGVLVRDSVENGHAKLYCVVSGGRSPELSIDDGELKEYSATIRPGETIEVRVVGFGLIEEAKPGRAMDALRLSILEIENEISKDVKAYTGDSAATAECSYTVQESDSKIDVLAHFATHRLAEDGSIDDSKKNTDFVLFSVDYTVVRDKEANVPTAPQPGQYSAESTALSGGIVREADSKAAPTSEGGRPPRNGDYIPDGAKDDSFILLVLGLALLLAAGAATVVIVLMVRKKSQRRRLEAGAGQPLPTRAACPDCGNPISPGDGFCGICGKKLS